MMFKEECRERSFATHPIEASVNKIAVLRANGIGDFVFTLPALESLRAAYPQAEIVLLGRPWHAEFLRQRPGPIDRVVVIPETCHLGQGVDRHWNPQEVDDFFAAMHDERFDLALQMQGGGRNSNPFVNRLAAGLTVGSRTPDADALDRWIPYRVYQREPLRHLEVASLVGAPPTTFQPRLHLTSSDLDAAYAEIPDDVAPLAVLHPSATDSRRCWPAEKFAQVGDMLAWQGFKIVINATVAEQETARAVRAAMRAPATDLSHGVSVKGLLGLLSRARIMISNDSGPAHLAGAVGCPTVVLFWCGNYMTGGPMICQNHVPLISWCLHCPQCQRHCIRESCSHNASFVADIPVADVLAAAHELLRC